jgi:transcription-repair coupling factor (superfamily II helicase)
MPDYILNKLLSGVASSGITRLQGLTRPAQAFTASRFFRSLESDLLLVTPDNQEAERMADDIAFFLGGRDEIIFLPQWETLPYEPLSPHIEISAARREAFLRLSRNRDGGLVCVTTFAALLSRLPPRESFAGSGFRVEKGKEIDVEGLKKFLVSSGYQFCDPVDEPGGFAFRGGIADIFPPSMSNPVRIELFGDEVESIRRFDIDTQRSLEWLTDIEIPPVKDISYGDVDTGYLFERLDELEKKYAKSVKGSLDEVKRKFSAGEFFPAMELYLPYMQRESGSLDDFFPENFSVLLCEPERIAERKGSFVEEIRKGYENAIERGDIFPPPEDLYEDPEAVSEFLEKKTVLSMAEISSEAEGDGCVTVATAESVRYRGAFNRFVYDCRQRLSAGLSTLVCVGSEESVSRLESFSAEEGVGILKIDGDISTAVDRIMEEGDGARVMVAVGNLSEGFEAGSIGLAVTTEEEIFGRHRLVAKKKKARKEVVFETDFSDVAPSDYVVHRDHGVGIYHGTKTISSASAEAGDEFLDIEYAEDQRLYLPVSSVYMIEKYSGGGGAKPKLDRMGGKSWQKTREKVKKGIMKMAAELLGIYARRETGKAFAFDTANTLNDDFADTFEYTETDDQVQAISDVLRDMAGEKPMDRLICGDVGYGKTEIAMRAAFAAAVEGKQTALLAPTTLLVNQHYDNFKGRMEKFGVKVGMLSRFADSESKKKTLEGLQNGDIDIAIGTHRILQKDVAFSDLGLIIIDEEQRFGVSHKEKLKKLRATVDVLTLTATPIPRTLHMSLSGIRDISVINTPPANRLSIKTYIRRKSEEVISEAVNREMGRGGQLFFVHNSVETISGAARYLKDVSPKARLAIAHGQMSGNELEKTMEKFIKHKIDILLCTTIIESGLDIPNANTIVIDRADKFGLAQLYQLRGRVGRDRHRAYAYLLVPDSMTAVARKRIKAIEELSELGSGFKLASRDMEIRGTGNLLGSQQSGQVTAVGFETYNRMLQEAVEELKSGVKSESVETELDLDFVGKLEAEYIPLLDQRMNYYNRLHRAKEIEEIEQAATEMADRYGRMPEKGRKLVDAMLLRAAGSRLKISKLALKGSELSLTFAPSSKKGADVANLAVGMFPGRVRPVGDSGLKIDISSLTAEERTKGVCEFLLSAG